MEPKEKVKMSQLQSNPGANCLNSPMSHPKLQDWKLNFPQQVTAFDSPHSPPTTPPTIPTAALSNLSPTIFLSPSPNTSSNIPAMEPASGTGGAEGEAGTLRVKKWKRGQLSKEKSVSLSGLELATPDLKRERSSDMDSGGRGGKRFSELDRGPPQAGGNNPRSLEDMLKCDDIAGSIGCLAICGGATSEFDHILSELSPKEKKTFHIVREILTTERTYLKVLNLLTVDFPNAVKTANKLHGAPVISAKELNMILGGLPDLKTINEGLLSDLEERIPKWKDTPKIGDIFVKCGPPLKFYAMYLKDYNSKYVVNLCKFREAYPLFDKVVEDFLISKGIKQKLGLDFYMNKPIQRMVQYGILLNEYLKSLEGGNEDYADAAKGLAIALSVPGIANGSMMLQDNAEKLRHIQNRLSGPQVIVKPERKLIKDGELEKVCRNDVRKTMLALTNDCLFCFRHQMTPVGKQDLDLSYELSLEGMRVYPNPVEDCEREFCLVSAKRSFTLIAKSPKERDDWLTAFNSAIDDNIRINCLTPYQGTDPSSIHLGQEAPIWVPDADVTMCQHCATKFNPIVRRHHCRACGKVVCEACSKNQAPLKYLGQEAERVCYCCYEYLRYEFNRMSFSTTHYNTREEVDSLRKKFKTENAAKRGAKIKKATLSGSETENISGPTMTGCLTWIKKKKDKKEKAWKRGRFELVNTVLQIYAAPRDIKPMKSVPLVGWQVELQPMEPSAKEATFILKRLGLKQKQIICQVGSLTTAEKWVAAISEAVKPPQ